MQIVAVILFANGVTAFDEPIPPIARVLPPVGIPLDVGIHEKIENRLNILQKISSVIRNHPLAPDIEIFTDAVELALLHDEFYSEGDADRALALLDAASARLDALQAEKSPWVDSRGLIVRGYRSAIDDSVQPYGLVIPDDLDLSNPVPLYVWLHGRGDQATNMAFLHQRQSQKGYITPSDAIVLHPFGRHCVGFKSAGEIDVLESIEHVAAQYNIDRRRIVLMGFSMGGAGCWHLGAHYADRWVAISPGAGFAETARYQNIDPDTVSWYERDLWGVYDVPAYVRNLFNLPVIAYSGENDKQIQAARVMEEAFATEGRMLNHLIGPGMGHQYHPETLAAILKELKTECDRGLDISPRHVALQTRTLRYHRVHWVNVQRLENHWADTRVDAERMADDTLHVTTQNVSALRLSPDALSNRVAVIIDGDTLKVPAVKDKQTGEPMIWLVKENGQWKNGSPRAEVLAKRPGLQGPIDDAFLDPFLVVLPSGECRHAAVQKWVDFEQSHFLDRWQALFRGKARIKRDSEVTDDDLDRYHLVLWGDPAANSVLGRIAERLPIVWTADAISAGGVQLPADQHMLMMIYPNPESPNRYVVINSGPTFREGHDRTNSLQNPKLPDWAIIDLSQPPDSLSAGRVVMADFFDESWQIRDQLPVSSP
ncbi:MAG: hypothetical protein O2955_21885 [Planctomycetota bacterium]|nr:hypothetical protein [Planctomycetota bacterium]MDA1215158.1 hypothetical protein [Planctomycetota bacterium]